MVGKKKPAAEKPGGHRSTTPADFTSLEDLFTAYPMLRAGQAIGQLALGVAGKFASDWQRETERRHREHMQALERGAVALEKLTAFAAQEAASREEIRAVNRGIEEMDPDGN